MFVHYHPRFGKDAMSTVLSTMLSNVYLSSMLSMPTMSTTEVSMTGRHTCEEDACYDHKHHGPAQNTLDAQLANVQCHVYLPNNPQKFQVTRPRCS